MTFIFVYGSLKKGFSNHHTLGKSVFLGEAITNSKEFTMFDGVFPFVSDGFNDDDYTGSVVGELYQITQEGIMSNLERLEGVPVLYVTREIDVTTLDNIPYKATIFVASKGSNDRIKHRKRIWPKGKSKLLEWK